VLLITQPAQQPTSFLSIVSNTKCLRKSVRESW